MTESTAEKGNTAEKSCTAKGSATEQAESLFSLVARDVAALFSGEFYATNPEYAAAIALEKSKTFRGSAGKREQEFIICECPIVCAVDAHAATYAAYDAAHKEMRRLQDLCRDEDGLIPIRQGKDGRWRTNLILDAFSAEFARVEAPYWRSYDVIGHALEVEMIVRMKYALTLAGVTDAALSDEICRCALHGGDLFDGGSTEEAYEKHEKEASARHFASLRAEAASSEAASSEAASSEAASSEAASSEAASSEAASSEAASSEASASEASASDPLACPHCGNPTDPNKARCPSCERLIG